MKKDYTHFILILDESGSMGSIWDQTIEGVNELVRQQKLQPGDFTTAVYKFSTFVGGFHDRLTFEPLNKINYTPRGGTALHDAICQAIDGEGRWLAGLSESQRPDKVVVVVVTDGFENSSRTYTLEDVKSRVKTQETTYKWQFVFLGANIDAFQTGGLYGFAATNTLQWTADKQGTLHAYACVTNTLTSYRAGVISCMNVQETVQQKEEQPTT